ncbi:MAG: hypothetical protein ACOC3I_05685 [Verrucomicrobiota bacterium]
MKYPLRLLCPIVLLSLLPVDGFARQEWSDLAGNTFKGEPTGLVGPLAIFQTPRQTGRLVPLDQLSPETCAEVYRALEKLPPPAPRWSEATGEATSEVAEVAHQLSDGEIVEADLEGRPEPRFIGLFFMSWHNTSAGWDMFQEVVDGSRALTEDFPEDIAFFFHGLRHNGAEHDKMVKDKNFDWLFARYGEQRRLRTFGRLEPRQQPYLYIIDRQGTPILGTLGTEDGEVAQTLTQARRFLEAAQVDDPAGWRAQLRFYTEARQRVHEKGSVAPRMIGFPLKREALASNGITAFTAHFEVTAEGRADTVEIEPGPGIPTELIGVVIPALLQTPFAPALDDGQPVAASYTLDYPFD